MNEKQTSLSGQTGTTTTVGGTGLTASQQTGAVSEAGKSIVQDAKHVASEVAGQAKQQVSTKIEGQKDKAAQGLSSVATALRQTSESLKDQDQLGVTQYFEGFADQVERLSDYVLSSNVGQLVEEAEGFARREPAIFLGSAFLLGLVGARFLKSSTPAPSYAGGEYLSENSYDYIRDDNTPQRGVSYGGTYGQRAGGAAYGSTGGREYRGGGDAGAGTSVERERARGVSGAYGSGTTGGSYGAGTGSSGVGTGAGSGVGSSGGITGGTGSSMGSGLGSGTGTGVGSGMGTGTGLGTSSGSGTSTGGTYGSGAGAGSTGGAYGTGTTGTGTGSTGSYGAGTSTGGTYGTGTSSGGTYGAGTGSTGSTSNLGGASTGSSGGYGAGTGMGTGVGTGSSTASSTASVGGGVTTPGMGTGTGTGISTGTGSGAAGVSGGGTYGAGTTGASTTGTGLEADVKKSGTTLPGTGKAPDASKGTEGSGK